ncbi:MAG: hypothetical protein ACLGI7_09355, partial [Gammaproteobacteria bacterium]
KRKDDQCGGVANIGHGMPGRMHQMKGIALRETARLPLECLRHVAGHTLLPVDRAWRLAPSRLYDIYIVYSSARFTYRQ